MANAKANLDGLKKLMRSCKKDYTLRVGIIGSEATKEHKGTSLTNAEIGTFHEFGTNRIPRRSFLEDPLKAGLDFSKDENKALKKYLWQQMFERNNPRQFFNDLGTKALDIIKASWASGGKPAWQSLTAATKRAKAKQKQSPNILTATGQLSKSISFKVFRTK